MLITGDIASVVDLPKPLVHDMLGIMRRFYDNVTEARFTADLMGKDWVILLRNAGRLCGFSTQKLFEYKLPDRTVRVMYSGDTIIEKESWGSQALQATWMQLMHSVLSERPSQDLYWLLTSKGHRTYRLLPLVFVDFYPQHGACLPQAERALLCDLCHELFGSRFDPEALVVRAAEMAQRLCADVADIEERLLRKNKHVAFFAAANPGFATGDELACIAHFHLENLRPFFRGMCQA